MKLLRRFVYAALLVLTPLSVMPSLATAEEAHGSFTLPHDVHWLNAFVPAGKYSFSFQPAGPVGLLMLQKLSGPATGFIMPVREIDDAKPADASRLVLEATPYGAYVKTLYLPQYGLTLRFALPSQKGEQKAHVATTALLARH